MPEKIKHLIPQTEENGRVVPREENKAPVTDIDKLIEPPSKHEGISAAKLEKAVRTSDIPMILMIFAIVVFGLVVLYSVSGPDAYGQFQNSAWFLRRQLYYTIFGFVMMFIIAFIPVDFFRQKWIGFGAYIVSFALAVATILMGVGREHGASRWINIGPIQLQGSEIIKVALIVSFAGYRAAIVKLKETGKIKEYDYDKKDYSEYGKKADIIRANDKLKQRLRLAMIEFVIPVGLAILVDVVIILQPHVSCFIIIALVMFLAALTSEIPIKCWGSGFLIILVAGTVTVSLAMALVPDIRNKITTNYAHVFKRIRIFNADEEEEDEENQLTKDDTRQVDNAFNALGSGGMWGAGFGNSRSKYNYVSEAQNDYIFSIYVEETGFVGGVILILMYVIMFFMCFKVCWRAKDVFSRTLAVGCTALIFVEVLMNLSVELQIIPSTGVTLPFVSYGGTAQISLLIAYGFILSVSRSGIMHGKQMKSEKSGKSLKAGN